MKRLSVIIPTYNMAALLPQCLDSLTATQEVAEQLDVVVVNDGSRDGSLAVAQSYAERFPQSVRVIDKPNGNYGSTINAALPTLQGEYVKVLDADDKFDAESLAPFLDALAMLSGVDMVVTPYVEITEKGRSVVEPSLYKRLTYNFLTSYSAEQVFADGVIRFFAMHGVAYRTALLQECGYKQTEGVSYTDQEWVFYPLFAVQTIAFASMPLYLYNLAREGQTMSASVQLRSVGQHMVVTRAMASYFERTLSEQSSSPTRLAFLREVLRMRLRVIYRLCLLDMADEDFAAADFSSLDSELQELAQRCSLGEVQVRVNSKIPIDLLGSYHNTGRRYNKIVRKTLRFADSVMMCLYRMIKG